MNLPLKVGSRASALALVQVEEVFKEIKDNCKTVPFELIKYTTLGDRDKTTSLTSNPADDFFTDALDQALLKGAIDIAIHSAKDLPKVLPEGLAIFALTQTLDDKDAWVGTTAWGSLPKNGRVGTSSLLRQAQILQLRPDAQIVDIRGTIGERIQIIKEGKVDGIIVAACALKRLNLAHEIKDVFPWEGTALQGQLAVLGRKGDLMHQDLFKDIDVRAHYGRVTLVGAGPGDPELITVKGVKALESADCVFYDYLADTHLLTHAPKAEHIYAGKRKGVHSMSQEQLSRLLKEKAMAGKQVVRLKGGDPLIFGRGADEINYLRSYHIEVNIIPGVSSATGIPSTLGLPLTARGISSSVAFVSGHDESENNNDLKPIRIPNTDTIVFLMGLTKLNSIVQALRESGRPETLPMMVIANGTRRDEQIVQGTLASIEAQVIQAQVKPPALIIAGNTIDLYQPRKQATLLHCGTHPDLYKHLGRIIHFPVIDIKQALLNDAQKKALWQEFEKTDMVLCTSRYAVECFINILRDIKPDVDLKHKVFTAIGRRTQEALEQCGIKPLIVGTSETAEGLLDAIVKAMDVKGKRMLFPRSSLPNPFLKQALIERGAHVSEVTVYENTKLPKRDLPNAAIDGIIFTSPSTVKNFLTDYDRIPLSWDILAKGPVTLKALQDAGYLCRIVTAG